MFFRLLIFVILAAIVFRAVKSWLGGAHQTQGRQTSHPPDQVDDVMIKDPVCGTYFPRRDAVLLKLDNQRLHFCSTECRDSYVAQKSQRDSH